jgi:hypothetical protein
MSKRLHDTDCWSKPWFRHLPAKSKILWLYCLDKCDCAGIWEIDFEQASFFTGEKFTENNLKDLEKQFKRIGEKRLLILDFIDFQYGELTETHKMRKKVFSVLAFFDLKYPIDTLSQNQDTVKRKDKDIIVLDSLGKSAEKTLSWITNSDEGFAEYLKISEPAFDLLLTDVNFISIQKEYFPDCCVKRTLCRMWEEFWGTKAGWKNKRDAARGKPDYEMDWPTTIKRNFKKSICYYGRDEVDDELTQIAVTKRMSQ